MSVGRVIPVNARPSCTYLPRRLTNRQALQSFRMDDRTFIPRFYPTRKRKERKFSRALENRAEEWTSGRVDELNEWSGGWEEIRWLCDDDREAARKGPTL